MKHWEEFWKNTYYPSILDKPQTFMYGGTDVEPEATINRTCFLDAVRHKFREGFGLLDYGCGAGIVSNILSERLRDFRYYGVEVNTDSGKSRIALANEFIHDQRCKFGIIDIDYDNYIKEKLDVIILISIFTHLSIEDVYAILDRLQKAFVYNKDISIVFSCFVEDKNRLEAPEPHVWERYYSRSFIDIKQIQSYCDKNNLKLEHWGNCTSQGCNVHEIYKIYKESI